MANLALEQGNRYADRPLPRASPHAGRKIEATSPKRKRRKKEEEKKEYLVRAPYTLCILPGTGTIPIPTICRYTGMDR
ncbi:hypothetical protein BHE74_00040269 [Ensete ventricosum]|nr:hypothetical protein BHE74_00040269 [Ensete ventricosum]